MNLGTNLDHSPLSEHRNAPRRRQRGPAAALVGPSGSGGPGRWELIPTKANWAEPSEGVRGAPAAGPGGRGVSGSSGRLRLMTGATPRKGPGAQFPLQGTLLWEATRRPRRPLAQGALKGRVGQRGRWAARATADRAQPWANAGRQTGRCGQRLGYTPRIKFFKLLLF